MVPAIELIRYQENTRLVRTEYMIRSNTYVRSQKHKAKSIAELEIGNKLWKRRRLSRALKYEEYFKK